MDRKALSNHMNNMHQMMCDNGHTPEEIENRFEYVMSKELWDIVTENGRLDNYCLIDVVYDMSVPRNTVYLKRQEDLT